MADVNHETGQPVELVEQPKEEPKALARLGLEELARLNLAALMRDIALASFAETWKPIQEKYDLPNDVIYDRVTGVVKESDNG